MSFKNFQWKKYELFSNQGRFDGLESLQCLYFDYEIDGE